MSKVLTIFIIVLASYLVFDSLTSEDNSAVATKNELSLPKVQPSSKSDEDKITAEPLYQIDSSSIPETQDINSDYLEGTYGTKLSNEHVKATLRFTFMSDGTFTDYRDMTFPDSKVGETQGTYTIDGAMLYLEYSDSRDKEVFRFGQAKMSLHKDGTLRTGTVVLNKQ